MPSAPTRFDFTYPYDGKLIDYSVWSTGDKHVKTILFLGTVQIEKLPVWVAGHCPKGTLVVQGVPH